MSGHRTNKSINVEENTAVAKYKKQFVEQSAMEPQMRQRVFTGVVTQMLEHHGIVDQEVHFPVSVVVGRVPVVGEKVLVKAVQDPLKSISWTAQRVQTLNGQPFKSPPPLLPSMSANLKPGILGNKPQPLLKSPKIPPLIPSMQPNPGGMIQMSHHQQMPWNGPFEAWGGGRKRHSEVMGGRRGGRWEDSSGGSWGGDPLQQKRKRWRPVTEDEVPRKSASINTHSSPLFSCFSRDTQSCDALELQRRYPHLQIPSDLFHLQQSWTESFPLNHPMCLRGPSLFHIGSHQPETPAVTSETSDSAFTVRVLLLSTPSLEDFYSLCCNLSKDGQTQKDSVHPTTLLKSTKKFMLIDSGGELQLPGGSWSSSKDGAEPVKDPETLINTAVRCVKDQTALDLSSSTQWHRMAELRYLSEGKAETVVFYLPDLWSLMPTEKEWTQLQQEQQDVESKLPELPSLVFNPAAGVNLSVMCLSSLLESQSSQTRDSCEVSLMAEMFSEMLQRDFGLQLYQYLCSLPLGPSISPSSNKDDNSKSVEDKTEKADMPNVIKKASDSKRRKVKDADEQRDTDGISLKDETELVEKPLGHLKESKTGGDTQSSPASDNQTSKENDCPPGWTAELPRKVLLSWTFFDRQLTGSVREQDLLNILLSLGLYISPAQALDLVRKTTVNGVCVYRNLCRCWTDTDHADDSISTEGNKALLPIQPCREKVSGHHSSTSHNTDVVNYNGNVINIPNLLRSLENSKTSQHELEKQIITLQSRLEAAEASHSSSEQDKSQHEELKRNLQEAEMLNKTYEKSLRENTSQMMSVIEKMQAMVEQTAALTREVKDKKM